MIKRRRKFDKDLAIRQAMEEFWRHGYTGATLARLKIAMGGICSPSLYAAFGSKKRLFEYALETYYNDELLPSLQLVELNSLEAIDSYLRQVVTRFTTDGKPRGCLVEVCQAESFAWGSSLQRQLSALRELNTQVVLRSLEQAQLSGVLVLRMEPRRLSELTNLLISGLSGMARKGASREHLLEVVETFLDCILLRTKDPKTHFDGGQVSLDHQHER
ncbi:TetR/AcrR family transcriptional regulator [Aquipseudomonas alcaligenes]|uniref:Transcriptional regulator, TetR family n=1 Tax=Aquipseudomonas alcaligenes TaxID=43263 RepID=A0A1N6NNW7_AQUAC|nr:TetR/AcrR family transcriptional regulator [Pseudomonas alcaligenes]SIP93733.1 transcriptional regulator, TetR family [Pseudomonas alcaligenes]